MQTRPKQELIDMQAASSNATGFAFLRLQTILTEVIRGRSVKVVQVHRRVVENIFSYMSEEFL